MPVSRRYLVKETSGRLVELPSALYDRAEDGTAPLPDFAGRCVEVVAAILVAERGNTPQVTEVAFTKLYFDQSGFVDPAKRDRMIRLMLESCADRRCRVVGHRRPDNPDCAARTARADAARNALTREYGWNPAPAEVSAALHVLDPVPVTSQMTSPKTVPTLH